MTQENNKEKTEKGYTETLSAINAPVIPNPHLFANGKFKAIEPNGTLFDIADVIYDGDISLFMAPKNNPVVSVPCKTCKIVARPISDMSDDEKNELDNTKFEWATPLGGAQYREEQWRLVYLLSIGVYPFNQNDFETGQVIDAGAV